MMNWSWKLTCTYGRQLLQHITAILTPTLKCQDYWLLTSNVGIKIQKALNCSTGLKNTGLFSHILGTSSLQNITKWKPLCVIHHQIPPQGYLLTKGPQLTFMKLFYKHVRNHDQARGSKGNIKEHNEKYEMYLKSVRRIINTNRHKTQVHKL